VYLLQIAIDISEMIIHNRAVMKIKYNAPVTLTFMIINFLVFLIKKQAIHDIIAKTNVVEV